MKNTNVHPHLSFDGCGINDRDEYRTRIATFTEKRGETANHYGPLFAAAPDMLTILEQALQWCEGDEDSANGESVEIDAATLRVRSAAIRAAIARAKAE